MTLGQRIATATGVLTASSLVARLMAIMTMPILTRLLEPQAYGVTAVVGTTVSLLAVIALAGMDMSYARAYHAKSGPSGPSVEGFTWRTTLGTGVIFGMLGMGGWWLLAPRAGLSAGLGGFVLAGVLLAVLQTMARTKARIENRYRTMAIAEVASSAIAAGISIGIASLWQRDESALLLSLFAGYGVVTLMLGVPPAGRLLRSSGISRAESRELTSIGIAGIVTAPMYWVMSSMDRWFLAALAGTAITGIYSIGYNVAVFGAMVNAAVAAIWLPEAARIYEADREAARASLGALAEKMITFLAIVWLAIVAAGGDLVRLLAAEEFHGAAEVVPYIAAAIFFNGLIAIANAGNLLAKALHQTIAPWLAGAAVCAALNLLLIPRYGMLGAAVTQTCSFAIAAAGVCYKAQRGFPVTLRGKRLLVTLAFVIALAGLMFPAWAATPVWSLLIKLPVGVVAAFAVAWVHARTDLAALWRKIS